jgi:hypothetical protein
LPFVLVWCVPIFLGLVISNAPVARTTASLAWAAIFAWMGGACLVNAVRCGRVHCYVSGPIFLIGGLATTLLGLGVIDFGASGLSLIVSATLALAAATYGLEWIFGRYRS